MILVVSMKYRQIFTSYTYKSHPLGFKQPLNPVSSAMCNTTASTHGVHSLTSLMEGSACEQGSHPPYCTCPQQGMIEPTALASVLPRLVLRQ